MSKQATRIVGIAFVAVLAAAFVWVWRGSGGQRAGEGSGAPGEVDLAAIEFPPFVLDVAALAPTWEAEREELGPLDADDLELLAAWQRDNFATGLSARGLFEGDADALRQAFERTRRQWASMRPVDEYRALGWAAYERFEEPLTELLRLARMTDTRLADLLDDPLNASVHAYYEGCGDFLVGALDHGIVGPAGELHVQPELILLMFRYRWMVSAAALYPVERALPGPELREFLRWRVEDSAVDLEGRLGLIDRFEREFGFTDYPVDFARAAAYAKAGDAAAALAALDRASEAAPDDPVVESVMAAIGRR